jgi:hypothetical protein
VSARPNDTTEEAWAIVEAGLRAIAHLVEAQARELVARLGEQRRRRAAPAAASASP